MRKQVSALESWSPHTKEELSKEMQREKELEQKEREAVEELHQTHSQILSGEFKKKKKPSKVSVDEFSNDTENRETSIRDKRRETSSGEGSRKGQEVTLANREGEKNVAKKASNKVSILREEMQVGPQSGTQNVANNVDGSQETMPRSKQHRTLWRFLCCSVVEESV
eukprot:jgi/Galph1/2903/GphlegSOOS_G1590.1